MRKLLFHGIVVLAALAILVCLPLMAHPELFPSAGNAPDGVSGASLVLPDQPSGKFIVLIRTDRHADTIGDWRNFFMDEEFAVIFDDIQCLVADGDVAAQQLAQRFRAQLPENQMRLRTENPTLLVSKAEAGRIDVAVFSEEMAQALRLAPQASGELTVVELTGGGE